MKRISYIWSVLLAILLVSCEEQLPKFDVTTIKVKAEWIDHDLHLSSSVDIASEVEILEQGFVLELPVFESSGYWNDHNDAREKRTVKVPVGTDVSYVLLSEGWEPELTCTVYAYVKTSTGNYRSHVEQLKTTEPKKPEFTNLIHIPSEKGPYYGGGKLIIEGKNLTATKESVSVYLAGIPLDVVKVESERITALYPAMQWNQTGEYIVKFKKGKREYILPQKMGIDGIQILSINPEKPRHGEKVTMYLENFTPGYIKAHIASNVINVDIEILEQTEEYITFHAPEYPSTHFEIQLQDKYGIWSASFVIDINTLWKKLDLADVGLESVQLSTDIWMNPNPQNSIFHRHIRPQRYIFRSHHGSGRVFRIPQNLIDGTAHFRIRLLEDSSDYIGGHLFYQIRRVVHI